MNWFGIVVTLALAIWFVRAHVAGSLRQVLLRVAGATADGTISEIDPHVIGEKPRQGAARFRPASSDAEFVAKGPIDHGLKMGDPVRVRYLPSRPAVAVIPERAGALMMELWIDVLGLAFLCWLFAKSI